jgi:5-enolpyruvylshikimate-3-phosphate synthase
MQGSCTIQTAEAMSVTFPQYAKLMQNLGANIKLT